MLLVQGSGNDRDLFAAGTFKATEWDPVKNTFRSIATPYDMFCAGHAFLPKLSRQPLMRVDDGQIRYG